VLLAVLLGAVLALAHSGCAPKEARDPADIIAEDPDFMPPGYEEGPPKELSGSGRPVEQAATRTECESAARHLERLGLRIAIAEARSPEDRAALEQQERELATSPAARARIEQSTTDCLGRETSAREARCIGRIESVDQVEACTR
jgi:hypothetical protein